MGTFAASTETRRNPKDHLTYVRIPAGTFRMGCSDGDKECCEDEKPPHMAHISHDFWIGQTEVTVAAFQSFGSDNAVRMPPDQKGDKFPVMAVLWDEADAYCKSAGGRLPTEAEWEYAARGGTTTVRYGDLNAIAWINANSEHMVHEVAMKQPNAYGLYDMLGNAWEWTADWYGSKYYENSPSVDPKGPPSGDTLALRGANMPVRVCVAVLGSDIRRSRGLLIVIGSFRLCGFRISGSDVSMYLRRELAAKAQKGRFLASSLSQSYPQYREFGSAS